MRMQSLDRSVRVRSLVLCVTRYMMTDDTTVVGNVSKIDTLEYLSAVWYVMIVCDVDFY